MVLWAAWYPYPGTGTCCCPPAAGNPRCPPVVTGKECCTSRAIALQLPGKAASIRDRWGVTQPVAKPSDAAVSKQRCTPKHVGPLLPRGGYKRQINSSVGAGGTLDCFSRRELMAEPQPFPGKGLFMAFSLAPRTEAVSVRSHEHPCSCILGLTCPPWNTSGIPIRAPRKTPKSGEVIIRYEISYGKAGEYLLP